LFNASQFYQGLTSQVCVRMRSFCEQVLLINARDYNYKILEKNVQK